MRPITISLDSETWELAKDRNVTKGNFSSWVRDKLRSERNQVPIHREMKQLIKDLDLMTKQSDLWWTMLMKERGGTVVEIGEDE
jgi:hypothetical protein|tara:strand:+ start:127 stop:378 length:252 start_codon:yes stop_codon:yes gene_type:complete